MPSVISHPAVVPWTEQTALVKSGRAEATSVSAPSAAYPKRIKDIRQSLVETNLRDEILENFKPETGKLQLPTIILYDERGLRIYEEITYLEEYYPMGHEIDLLKCHSAEIAAKTPEGSMIIELGSGKTRLLLEAFEAIKKPVDYCALDLSHPELERTINQLPEFIHVTVCGLWGTYDDCLEWLKTPSLATREKTVLHMGSSIGNFSRSDAASFLRNFCNILRPGDRMLIGLDACNNPNKVYHAYNDSKGVTHKFILNGLRNANRILGQEVFNEDDWRVIGEYVHDNDGGRHQALYSPKREVTVLGTTIFPHNRIFVEQSLKYSPKQTQMLWSTAGFQQTDCWMKGDEYGLHMLERPSVPFSPLASIYASSFTPTISDWEALWKVWDNITTKMLSETQLLEKPIKLRNSCIFYLGHIPTFLDIQLTKKTGTPATSPASYKDIFERGIDPDVDNPEICHAHSNTPDEWPHPADIRDYQRRVRTRLRSFYDDKGHCKMPRDVARAVWASFEHEVMHIETFLFMLLQSDKTLPPPGTIQPDFATMARESCAMRVENEWHNVPEQRITIGIDDPESGVENIAFGWDNEKPQRTTHVSAFQAKGCPITNDEYARYMYANGIREIPVSWSQNSSSVVVGPQAISSTDSIPASFTTGKFVKTFYGPVPLEYALDWPISASYDELAGCAEWLGGRIPTFAETRSIYAHVDKMKRCNKEKLLNLIGVNNDSCSSSDSFSLDTTDDGFSVQDSVFIDLDGTNTGFRNWHPVSVTALGNKLAGQSDMGGVWEWTSTPLRKYTGFEPMELYPEFTADFFDGKHNIALGGSWAVHPRIAGRKSFVNWYQRNYKHAWIGARIVRDI
ncbi:hypothetical protein Cpir12675_002777 [Ceratocystis pirilliformis]|uniref:Uncharacterized protein n=1 Tax=Ceratocystis pirilliformis TaxID=259994 RepID=A0ABR3Z725_9PEZI